MQMSRFLLVMIACLLFFSVQAQPPDPRDNDTLAPSVNTAAILQITTNSALVGGSISKDGGAPILEKGIVFSATNNNPTLNDTQIAMGTGIASFSQTISGLTGGTTYYVRAYATNIVGTGYGAVVVFTTASSPPIVSTEEISSIGNTSATVGGNVSLSGGATVNERGIVYSITNTTPTINDTKVQIGSGTGVFSQSITGLSVGVLYHVRAYAINSAGTNYGNVMSFISSGASVSSDQPSAVSSSSATLGGVVSSVGGSAVTERGIVYVMGSDIPTLNNTKIVMGLGIGNFSQSITQLSPGTLYSARAFATNNAGTNYGAVQRFTTQTTVNSITRTGAVRTSTNLVSFSVVFAQSISGLKMSNFSLTGSGLTGSFITSVVGSGTSYTVTVFAGSGTGTLGLNLITSTGISPGIANSLPYTGEQYFIDRTPPVVKTNTPSSVCPTQTIDLTTPAITAGSDAGLTFTYFSDSTANTVLPNPSAIRVAGVYYIRGYNGFNLSAPIPVNVVFHPLPAENILTSGDTIVCSVNAPLTLSVGSGSSYVWFKNGTVVPGATTNQLTVTGIGDVYTVSITSSVGCTAAALNRIRLSLRATPKASYRVTTFCRDIPIGINNSSEITATGPVSYSWTDNVGNTSLLNTPSFRYNQTGTYQLKLKVASVLCPLLIDSITQPVTIIAPIPAQRLPTVNVNFNEPVQLQARPSASSYNWSPSTGLSNTTIARPIVNTANQIQYTIQMITEGGCSTTDTLLVRVYADKVYVPTAFTPNGDGLNDRLFVNLIGINVLQRFAVFNRYGKKVFETANATESWDGSFNGISQPLDTYVWIVEGIDKDGKRLIVRGAVTLIR